MELQIYKSRNLIQVLDLKLHDSLILSTKVEILYRYQTRNQSKEQDYYLQKQKSYIGIRPRCPFQLTYLIYKSRNLIQVLDLALRYGKRVISTKVEILYRYQTLRIIRRISLSTKVEILYRYQTTLCSVCYQDLQKQKSYIGIRLKVVPYNFNIYKSRNLIQVLDF